MAHWQSRKESEERNILAEGHMMLENFDFCGVQYVSIHLPFFTVSFQCNNYSNDFNFNVLMSSNFYSHLFFIHSVEFGVNIALKCNARFSLHFLKKELNGPEKIYISVNFYL